MEEVEPLTYLSDRDLLLQIQWANSTDKDEIAYKGLNSQVELPRLLQLRRVQLERENGDSCYYQ